MALINIVLASKRRRHRKATGSSFFVSGSIASVKSSSPSPKQSGFFDEWPADCLVVILVVVVSYSYLLYLSIFG
ncbi:hypothetical protein GQ457_16G028890 [Hibiscus cannabinus]